MPAPPRGNFATTRPVAILMVFLAAVVFGYLSYGRLPVALMPELTDPTLTVRTAYPGAAPEEIENDVSRPIEEALGVVGGLQKIGSISRADVSDVVLEFDWESDMSDATQDVLERLDLVVLPEEAERPLILHYDPALDPMMELSLSADTEATDDDARLRRLRRLADLQVKRAIEPIKGVAAVRVKGGLEEEIHVLLGEDELRRSGISIQTVIDRIAQENINIAGGTIKEGRIEYMVRTLNEFADVDQIASTVITRIGDREVRVGDLGRVVRTHKDREMLTRTSGASSVQIEIFKEAEANIVALAHRVRSAIEGGVGNDDGLAGRLRAQEDVSLQVVSDRSLFIESSIREVRNTAILGGLLAVAILFLFLRNIITTLIIALSIPISLLITFAPLNLLGISLNIMSLGGLALGIGMLVDSSIVVLESIHRRREEGDGLVESAVQGTREVRAAVLASTLTSIAVFFPMVFVEGVAGQAFGHLGLAVVISLLASVVVALFFIPMLASRSGLGHASDTQPGKPYRWQSFAAWDALRASFSGSALWLRIVAIPYWAVRFVIGILIESAGKILLGAFAATMWVVFHLAMPVVSTVFRGLCWLPVKLTDLAMSLLGRAYPRTLRAALAHPGMIFVIVGLTLFGTWQIVARLDSELLPEVHQGEFNVEVALPVGTPLEETERVLAPIERAILEETQHIRSLLLTVGYDPTNSRRSDEGEHTASFTVLLVDEGDPVATEEKVTRRLRARFAGIPDLSTRITRPVLFSSRTPIEVEIHGDDLSVLRDVSRTARGILAKMPEIADVQTTLRSGAPEVQILYDRDRLALYGLDISAVARRVRDKVKGFQATRFNLKDRRIPIVVRLEESDRKTVADVKNLDINPGGARAIPLSSVATVTLGEGPSEVRRIDGGRVALLSANLTSGSLSAAIGRIRRELDREIDWPAGVTFLISGQNEEWQRSRGSLFLALGLSIFLVYVIMAAQFESLVQPLVIMFTIPLAFIGTVVALRILHLNVSVVVVLGMIMLAGIVVNNAIVLVDYINTLRRRGLEMDQAIVQAGSVRLRPILMTTATTVLGLLPMAIGFGDGAEIRTPMAVAVISGLLSSTALTLVVIPTLYAVADRFTARLFGNESPLDHATGAGSVPPARNDPVYP
ncbi:MAG: efflux RND transporter permease subunit [Acidobacteriota bacterium]